MGGKKRGRERKGWKGRKIEGREGGMGGGVADDGCVKEGGTTRDPYVCKLYLKQRTAKRPSLATIMLAAAGPYKIFMNL